MWVFTTSGFYSVVKKSHSTADELEVRGRCRRDLAVLKKKTGTKSKILTNAGTDYPFRLRINREVWARFLADSAMEIDYGNFKDQVLSWKIETPRRRRHRHDVYLDVWKALLRLSDTPGKRQQYDWRELEGSLEGDQCLIDSIDPDSSPAPPGANAPRKPTYRYRQSKFW